MTLGRRLGGHRHSPSPNKLPTRPFSSFQSIPVPARTSPGTHALVSGNAGASHSGRPNGAYPFLPFAGAFPPVF